MKNVFTRRAVFLFVAACSLAGCQSTPTTGGDAGQPKPGEATKMDPAPAVAAPAAPEATAPMARPPEPAAAPEAKAETMTVMEMQKRLTEFGYHPGPADGVAGKRTTDALKKFQQANHLPATGVLDPETIRRLGGGAKK